MSDKTVTKVTGFENIPALKPRVFKVDREDEVLEFKWVPLTFEQTETIRSNISKPIPPMKKVPLGSKDLVLMAQRGQPTEYPDEGDPEYQEKLREYENRVSLETLRLALGWDMDSLAFAEQAKRVFAKGELDSFVDEVTSASFRLDGGLIQRFLSTSLQGQKTAETSSDTEEASS